MEKQEQQVSKTKLSGQFIAELLKACLTDRKVLEICKEHLDYNFLETIAQRNVFKYLFTIYELENKVVTVGVLAQQFNSDSKTLAFLKDVKNVKLDVDNREALLMQLEDYIRKRKFIQLFNTTHELYNEGKQDKAIDHMAAISQQIAEFTLKDKYYQTVFEGYDKRHQERVEELQNSPISQDKVSSGITELDELTYGGWKKGTSFLVMARSGMGKSTALRQFGMACARMGGIVVHIQGEGTEKECLEGYDAAFTGIKLSHFETEHYIADVERVHEKIEKARKAIREKMGGEIVVYASERFDALTLSKCRDVIQDVVNKYGRVDLVLFDYLEIMSTGGRYANNQESERKRREDIANQITNIAAEFNCVTGTATQANDIAPKDLHDPDFVMTRSHISEFKGTLKPFSYFMTFNATPDEYDKDILRIFCDKFRRYKSGQTITIAQKKENGRFYDIKRTMNEGLYVNRSQ